METFSPPKPFTENPHFRKQRLAALGNLPIAQIDPPIAAIVTAFSELSYCFTLQCCCGHFLYEGMQDPQNLAPLPESEISGNIEYRIAYIALCIEENKKGEGLFEELRGITAVDPEYIQFGSAGWFWERQVNSYTLQVEPAKFQMLDSAEIGYKEARHVEKTRNLFINTLENLINTMV